MLSGAAETHNGGKAAFQEMDAISLLTPHTKLAVRPHSADVLPKFINDAYRAAYFGRPGPAFVDLPANIILGNYDTPKGKLKRLTGPPMFVAPEHKIRDVANAIISAKAPLVVVGKGAAYARAEGPIRKLIDR